MGRDLDDRVQCHEPGAATFVDCVGHVSSVTLNGEALDPATHEPRPDPAPRAPADNVLVVSSTQPDTGAATRSCGRSTPTTSWSTSGRPSSPTWPGFAFACFDQPDLKAPHGFVVDAHESWTVTSNSAPDEVVDLDDGGRRWTFGDTPPLSTYVTVVNAGPFHELRSQRGGYDLGLYSRQSLKQFLERDAEELFDLTDRGLAFFGERFGQPFAQERYDQVFVPNMGGAMENWGSVTWTDSVLYRSTPTYGQRAARAQILLHEMAHMWFGDLVTMRWWDDLWLNEAFASWASNWAGVHCTEFTDEWATFLAAGKMLGYRQDMSPATHPIRGEVPNVAQAMANFDAITYTKGASVLKQLMAYVGEETFVAGLRGLLPAARLGQHRARRPDVGDRGGRGPRPRRLDGRLAGPSRHRRRPPGRRGDHGDVARRRRAASPPPRHRLLRRQRPGRRWPATTAVETAGASTPVDLPAPTSTCSTPRT